MSYKLIDGYSEDREALLDGQSFPVPSLLKNGGDKILFMDGEEVPVSTVANAMMSNATEIRRPNGSWITMEEFSALDLDQLSVDESGSEPLYRIHEFMWHPGVAEAPEAPQEAAQPQEEASEEDDSPVPFVHLHTHSEFSALDGLATADEIVAQAVAQGNTAVAVTDHGVCAGHPALQKACEKAGIKPIFGMEAYLVENRFDREDAKTYYHITLWAMDSAGLRNLWAISTEGYRDGFHGHPRIDWDTLERLNTGIIASSGCLRGPVPDEVKNGNLHKAQTNSQRLLKIFGDRYYIELHTNHLAEQIKVNKWLVKHANEFDIPVIAAVDSHYAHANQRDDHQVWLSVQINKDVEDESSLFGGGQDYHMLDQVEVFESLAYLGEEVAFDAMLNTQALADRCNATVPKREGMPRYHHGADAEEKDRDLMLDICFDAWEERVGYKGNFDAYEARFERESRLLIDKGFPGYFLMNADLVKYAKDNGVLVGPGRGSGAGSLVAYLMGITEVDPVENDLLFERFMTEGRTALPDFDIDYPSSKKQFMIDYAERRWGKSHVCAVGTNLRLKNKGAFKDTGRAILSRLPQDAWTDIEAISKIITQYEASTAGLGLKHEELLEVAEELKPYKETYPELFALAEKFYGRLKTYSRHAAGLILDPQYDLEGSLPMFLAPDGKTLSTQFDKDVLEEMGFVKFDFLNLRNLDTLQEALDLIHAQTEDKINVYKWREEYKDFNVFAMISEGWTLGMFQIETPLGTRTVKQLKPKNLDDLADCITLGRPGPIRSGLDKTYFKRREGKEKVSFPDPRLKQVLARTYGTMIYQEDIMAVTIVLANYSDNEADKVRRILGKKKKDEAAKAGKVFVDRAVENQTGRPVAQGLWDQMEQFALYSFNRAHAFAYAVLAYWTAWFKTHYPVQFATACLSTVEKEEIPDWVAEARRLGYKVLPPDVNESGFGFTNTATTVRYGLDSIKGVGSAATQAIIDGQPYGGWDDFMDRRGEKCNMGHIKTLAHIGAFDSLVPNRRALEKRLAEEDVKPGERCIFFQLMPLNKYNELPCGFDWDSEPKKLGRTGKPLKNQPPVPKKCSKACRNWTPRPLPTDDDVEPYTDKEIREIEMEALGIYLSSSPFDIIDSDDMAELWTANQLQAEEAGRYLSVIMVQKVRPHHTKDGKAMAFVTADTPSGIMDLTVFSDKLDIYGSKLRPGQMALVEVNKNNRGMTLGMLEAL